MILQVQRTKLPSRVAALLLGGLLGSFLLLGGTGCSSGDGSEDVLIGAAPLQASLTQEISQLNPPPGAPFITLEDGGSPAQGLHTVNVRAVGVTDLWALAFTLEFDPAVVEFITNSEENGGFLGPDSQVDVLAAPEPGRSDRLVVSATKLRQDPSDVGSSGTGEVMSLTLRLVDGGSTVLDFAGPPANTAAIDSQDNQIFGINKFFTVTVVVD